MLMRFVKSTIRGSAFVAGVLASSLALAAGSHYKFSSPCNEPGLREAVLQQVNAARVRGANCGGQVFGPAQSVSWNAQLVSAASGHSLDMAENNYFDHRSLSGTRPAQRVQATGYKWKSVAENIAAGMFNTRTVVQGWMESPGHCVNIMDPKYNEIGVACIARPGTTYGEYWTMVLARRMGAS